MDPRYVEEDLKYYFPEETKDPDFHFGDAKEGEKGYYYFDHKYFLSYEGKLYGPMAGGAIIYWVGRKIFQSKKDIEHYDFYAGDFDAYDGYETRQEVRSLVKFKQRRLNKIAFILLGILMLIPITIVPFFVDSIWFTRIFYRNHWPYSIIWLAAFCLEVQMI